MSASKKIVSVDDDPHIRKLIELTLPAPEFQVMSFGDGRDALMRLHQIAPDLIIADIMMPEMDGRTFFQVVKRSQELRHVPFIFLSAIHATDQIVATMEAGADDFVNKPFSPIRLLAKVRGVLRLAGRTDAYQKIVRGSDTFQAGIPESFNVLVKELRSLGLNVELKQSDPVKVAQ